MIKMENIGFTKYENCSVEQIVFKDYEYFKYLSEFIDIRNEELEDRFDFADMVVNSFVPQVSCDLADCESVAEIVSYDVDSVSEVVEDSFYCSEECFESSEVREFFVPLRFDYALGGLGDTSDLISIMKESIGVNDEIIEDSDRLSSFFDECPVYESGAVVEDKPYSISDYLVNVNY